MNRYLITDPTYYTSIPALFEDRFQTTLLRHIPQMVCFRDKVSSNIEELIPLFVKISREHEIHKCYINGSIDLALKYQAYGVHLRSDQFDQIKKALTSNLDVIISCHNEEEIKEALKNNITTITYSPIFQTPNKGEPKGIEVLKKIIKHYSSLNIIALGGIISHEHIEMLKSAHPYGFASIRYFIPNDTIAHPI